MAQENHWQSVYDKKETDNVSWFRPHLEESLRFITEARLPLDARIIDAGGGASTLVDDLLDLGYTNLAVLDLAESALAAARERLGDRAANIDWLVGDVLAPLLPDSSVDFWHDRAVFHFLTAPDAQAAYLRQVQRTVKDGGYVLIATFGPDGPEKCSGLPVTRYDAEGIHAVFGSGFQKIGNAKETHTTPWGSEQSFVYCFCRHHRRD